MTELSMTEIEIAAYRLYKSLTFAVKPPWTSDDPEINMCDEDVMMFVNSMHSTLGRLGHD